MITALKDAYFKAFRNPLAIYGVPGSLTPYMMTQSDLKKQERSKMPSEDFRLEDDSRKKSKKMNALIVYSEKK